MMRKVNEHFELDSFPADHDWFRNSGAYFNKISREPVLVHKAAPTRQ